MRKRIGHWQVLVIGLDAAWRTRYVLASGQEFFEVIYHLHWIVIQRFKWIELLLLLSGSWLILLVTAAGIDCHHHLLSKICLV